MMQKRQTCSQCLRPLSTCVCKYIHVVNNHVELIILQHPLEVTEAKNTARLLHLCMKNSQLHVGEQFSNDFFTQLMLNPILSADISSNASAHTSPYNLLLYPETPEEKSMGILSPPAIDIERLSIGNSSHNTHPIRLWVLDATWRKSRKMLYLNPALQTLPRLQLQPYAPSIYTIRKAHSENQLSTLEASCYALQQLEQQHVNYTPLLTAFAAFIAQQKTFIPRPHL
jgi:DTW domain-containing protein YfiP